MKYNQSESVLNAVRDADLIQNLQQYAEAAGLAGFPQAIWQSVKNNPAVTPADMRTIKSLNNFKAHGKSGLIWHGVEKQNSKFIALTGLLVRNYIDACYMTMTEIMQGLRYGEQPLAKILFIPDFYIHRNQKQQKQKREVYEWKAELVYSFLLKRFSDGKFTCMYVSDYNAIYSAYGNEVGDFLKDHYVEVSSNKNNNTDRDEGDDE